MGFHELSTYTHSNPHCAWQDDPEQVKLYFQRSTRQ